jgi:AAA domain
MTAAWEHDPRRLVADSADFEPEPDGKTRRVRLIRASDMTMRATRWLWEEDARTRWLPLGGLTLLGGREGVGKTTIAYGIAARVTRGTLPGSFHGTPKSVVVAATEDAWEQTILPRLVAAGADLDCVFRVDTITPDGYPEGLSLPEDVAGLRLICEDEDVALVLLDPLIGTVGKALDSHKDADVRRALEPLSRLAHDVGVSLLGLIHVNKTQGNDLLTRLMASRAFSAVARAVLFAAAEETPMDGLGAAGDFFLFEQAKNNLAAKVPHTLRFHIEGAKVGYDQDLDEPIYGARIVWDGQVRGSIQDVVTEQESRAPAKENAQDRAAMWLEDYLGRHGPTDSRKVKNDADLEGHAERTLKRVLGRVGVVVTTTPGANNATRWSLPDPTGPTDPADPTGPTLVRESGHLGQLGQESGTGQAGPAPGPTPEPARWTR